MKIIKIPSQYLHEFKPPQKPQVRKSIGKAPVDWKMTPGAYVVPQVERLAQAMTENQKKPKAVFRPNYRYIKKMRKVKTVIPERQWIEFTNAAGRVVRKLAP